MISFDNELAI